MATGDCEETLDFEMECVEELETRSFSSHEAKSTSPWPEAAAGNGEAEEISTADHVAREVTRLFAGGEFARTLRAIVAEQVKAERAKARATAERVKAKAMTNLRAASGSGSGLPRRTGGHRITSTPKSFQGRCRGECSVRSDGSSRDGRGEMRVGGDLVEPFDPEDQESNIDRWLHKIDQLAAIHGWSEYERSCFAQAKLRGAARTWFNRLEDYDLTWDAWKVTLRRAFPRRHDFAASLKELVARAKRPGETMTSYYHAKLALCERCSISGENAISCIIGGLPMELQANARAFQCRSPGDLYAGFLAGLEAYQVVASSRDHRQLKERKWSRQERSSPLAGRFDGRTDGGSPDSSSEGGGRSNPAEQLVRCYNCQELGSHISRHCPRPRVDRCRRCGKPGHHLSECPLKAAESDCKTDQLRCR